MTNDLDAKTLELDDTDTELLEESDIGIFDDYFDINYRIEIANLEDLGLTVSFEFPINDREAVSRGVTEALESARSLAEVLLADNDKGLLDEDGAFILAIYRVGSPLEAEKVALGNEWNRPYGFVVGYDELEKAALELFDKYTVKDPTIFGFSLTRANRRFITPLEVLF